jgi:uncharacterized membrane-anchored protein YhcB (DUF1043 family)
MTDTATLLDAGTRALERALKGLDRCVARVEADLDGGEYDTKLGSHLAYLAEKLSPMINQLRQLEKHAADAAKKLTPAENAQAAIQIVTGLPRELRAHVLEQIRPLAEEGALGR